MLVCGQEHKWPRVLIRAFASESFIFVSFFPWFFFNLFLCQLEKIATRKLSKKIFWKPCLRRITHLHSMIDFQMGDWVNLWVMKWSDAENVAGYLSHVYPSVIIDIIWVCRRASWYYIVTSLCIHHAMLLLAGRNRKCNLIHNRGCASGTLSPFLPLILPLGPCPLQRKREIYNLADGRRSMGNFIIKLKVLMLVTRVECKGWIADVWRMFLLSYMHTNI